MTNANGKHRGNEIPMERILKASVALLFVFLGASCANVQTNVAGKPPGYYFETAEVAALVTAIANGKFDEADQALKAGADVNAVGAEGMSPLLWVMGTTLNLNKIEYLLKAGANPNYQSAPWLISPMHLAAGGNRSDILELLLKHRGDPNLPGRRGQTLLMVAVMQFRDKNVELLLRYGADISQTDERGESVAATAAGMGRFDQVVFFLERGLKYDVRSLARSVDVRQVPANSEAQRWKDKAIEILKARGATFPTLPLAEYDASGRARQAARP